MFLHGASRGPIGIALVIGMIAVRMLMRGGFRRGRGTGGRGPFGRRGPFL